MVDIPDPYRILKVSPDASQAAIKDAYRRLAKAYHPDLNKSDPVVAGKFREIQTAYEVLRDQDKRSRFDRETWSARSHQRNRNDQNSDLWDMFRRPNKRTVKPDFTNLDIWHSVVIPFELAMLGGKKILTLSRVRKLHITIPSSSRDGMRLRIKGQGLENNGNRGDLFVVLQVPDDTRYRVIMDDIHIDVAISLRDAILGGKVALNTLHGKVMITIKPGTNAGTQLRLKKKGMPASESRPAGDCLVHVNIRLPEPIPEALKIIASQLPKDV